MYDHQTSGTAYATVKPHIGRKQDIILKAIRLIGVCNDRQLSEMLNLPINQITPRRNELVTMGQVECDGKRIDPRTKRTTNFWKVKTII